MVTGERAHGNDDLAAVMLSRTGTSREEVSAGALRYEVNDDSEHSETDRVWVTMSRGWVVG